MEKAEVLFNEKREPIRIVGIIQDITSWKLTEIELREKNQKLTSIFNHLETGIWSFDVKNNTFLVISDGVERITGYLKEEFMDQGYWEKAIHPEDLPLFKMAVAKVLAGKSLYHQYRIINKSGEVIWVHDQIFPVLNSDGTVKSVDGIIKDITELKVNEEKVKYLAYHDSLTHLPNKRNFEEKLGDILEGKSVDSPEKFAILYLDMDGFKRINDSLGHFVGDELLTLIASRLKRFIHPDDFVARLGGDEFTILVKNLKEIEQVPLLAKRLILALEEPYEIQDYELFITASIGISLYPDDGNDLQALLQKADTALYRAKELGKNNYQIYSTNMNLEAFKLYQLARDLRQAVHDNELYFHFQPKVNIKTGKIIGVEALIRWEHPHWGVVSPKEFIPLAEESNLIVQITDWTLFTVCNQIKQWEEKKIPYLQRDF